MKLQSMTEFVLEQKGGIGMVLNLNDFTDRICNYAQLLSQPLQLGMFVPCDLEGNVVTKPCDVKSWTCIDCDCEDNYNLAVKRVLFEGFTAKFKDHVYEITSPEGVVCFDSHLWLINYNVEELMTEIKLFPVLTQSEITKIKGV